MVHTGLNPLESHVRGMMFTSSYFLAGDDLPEREAVEAGEGYMALLVDVAREAYTEHWSNLNLPSDFTLRQLAERGMSLEDLEEEFGLPRGWSAGVESDVRLALLKQYSGTDIERLAQRYPLQ